MTKKIDPKEQIIFDIGELIIELQSVYDNLQAGNSIDEEYDDLECQSGTVRTILDKMEELL